jgi:hypothetical protein
MRCSFLRNSANCLPLGRLKLYLFTCGARSRGVTATVCYLTGAGRYIVGTERGLGGSGDASGTPLSPGRSNLWTHGTTNNVWGCLLPRL